MARKKQHRDGNVYGEVNSASDVREINQQIRAEMNEADSRDELTELKRRADYLCTLALAPSWQEKFGDDADAVFEIAQEEDRLTTDRANKVARSQGWDADYDAWGPGR